MSVIIDEPASDRLLKESAAIDKEPVINAAIIFNMHKNMFIKIPAAPESMPYLLRFAADSVSDGFLMKSLIKSDVN